eukprot:scaffold19060_cov62-Phaeocystis_antarctica.AAC.7
MAVTSVLDLEVAHQLMADAHGGGGDGVGPHLLHPALHHPLRVARRGANRIERGTATLRPVAAHDAVLRLVAMHVPEDEGRGLTLRRQVRDGPHQHVVSLQDEDELRGDLPQHLGGIEQRLLRESSSARTECGHSEYRATASVGALSVGALSVGALSVGALSVGALSVAAPDRVRPVEAILTMAILTTAILTVAPGSSGAG